MGWVLSSMLQSVGGEIERQPNNPNIQSDTRTTWTSVRQQSSAPKRKGGSIPRLSKGQRSLERWRDEGQGMEYLMTLTE